MNRAVDDFAQADIAHSADGVPRLFLDDSKSNRADLVAMLSTGIRKGHTVVVLALGDLGKGFAIATTKKAIADAGASLDVIEAPTPEPRKRGPKPRFAPTPEQRAELVRYWHNPTFYPGPYALGKCRKVMGDWLQRYHLNGHLGPRNKPK